MPRSELILAKKVALLDEIKKQPRKTSLRKLGEATGVSRGTIARLLKNESQLREAYQREEERGLKSKTIRNRHGKDPDVEEALSKWFASENHKNISISGPILKSKANEFAALLGHHQFKATDGWLSRWKVRNNIQINKTHREKRIASNSNEEKSSTTLQNFHPEDIYNACATGLYYRATPDGALNYNSIALSGYKMAMDHLVILCCVNMTGNDKKQLLVVGKNAHPRCFKNIKGNCLPVLYKSNKNAWITPEIFNEWLVQWDDELASINRNILLLVDNYADHSDLVWLQHIKLECLPSVSTSLHQPMQLGIIKNIKTGYKARIVSFILDSIASGDISAQIRAFDISSKITILQAIQLISESWKSVSIATIQSCLRDCGFAPFASNCIQPETIGSLDIVKLCTGHELFLSVDDDIICYSSNGSLEDEIVECIIGKTKSADALNEELVEEVKVQVQVEENLDEVSNVEARTCVQTLRHYFKDKEGCCTKALEVYSNFIDDEMKRKSNQTTLDSFLLRHRR